MAARFTATMGRLLRALSACRVRATSSLPVPVSPVMSTVASVGAAAAMSLRTARILSPLPKKTGPPFRS